MRRFLLPLILGLSAIGMAGSVFASTPIGSTPAATPAEQAGFSAPLANWAVPGTALREASDRGASAQLAPSLLLGLGLFGLLGAGTRAHRPERVAP